MAYITVSQGCIGDNCMCFILGEWGFFRRLWSGYMRALTLLRFLLVQFEFQIFRIKTKEMALFYSKFFSSLSI
jgi:hypothetical protein